MFMLLSVRRSHGLRLPSLLAAASVDRRYLRALERWTRLHGNMEKFYTRIPDMASVVIPYT